MTSVFDAARLTPGKPRRYTFVDDYLKTHPTQAQWRRSPNKMPAFIDAEVITLGLMQGVFGCATLKKAYLLIAAGWRSACRWTAE